ncbi:hypothetical protein D9M72_552950 [compost metagenome]
MQQCREDEPAADPECSGDEEARPGLLDDALLDRDGMRHQHQCRKDGHVGSRQLRDRDQREDDDDRPPDADKQAGQPGEGKLWRQPDESHQRLEGGRDRADHAEFLQHMGNDRDRHDDADQVKVDFECGERLAVENHVNGHDGVSLNVLSKD